MAWSSAAQRAAHTKQAASMRHGGRAHTAAMVSSEDSSGDSASSKADVGGLLCRARSSMEEITREQDTLTVK
jgi:hypothetical protein